MSDLQLYLYDVLEQLNADQIIDLFLNYYGLQLLDEEFYDYLVDEGIIEEEE